jgi:hypothetical protein
MSPPLLPVPEVPLEGRWGGARWAFEQEEREERRKGAIPNVQILENLEIHVNTFSNRSSDALNYSNYGNPKDGQILF